MLAVMVGTIVLTLYGVGGNQVLMLSYTIRDFMLSPIVKIEIIDQEDGKYYI
jgi:hypothetical protein